MPLRVAYSSPPPPEVPLAAFLDPGLSAPALATSPTDFLPGSTIQEADLDAAAGSGTLDPSSAVPTRVVSMRGAVLAPATNHAVSHPSINPAVYSSTHSLVSAQGPEDIRVLPASAVMAQRRFTMRGELMHAFVSYRVSTEGIVFATPELWRDLLPCCTRVPQCPR